MLLITTYRPDIHERSYISFNTLSFRPCSYCKIYNKSFWQLVSSYTLITYTVRHFWLATTSKYMMFDNFCKRYSGILKFCLQILFPTQPLFCLYTIL